MGKDNFLMRLTPEEVRFYLAPYGDICIANNGQEVNVFWSIIPKLELNFPETLTTWQFKLHESIPLNTRDSKQIATEIKAALDNAIAQSIAEQPILYSRKPETGLEVRVIKEDGEYIIQTRFPGTLWENQLGMTDRKQVLIEAISFCSL